MTTPPPPTLLLIGAEAALAYLLARFAEHSGYACRVSAQPLPSAELQALRPAAIIFLTPEALAQGQGGQADLTGLDLPLLVCASAGEAAQARALGADYCLLHPLTYSDFQAALAAVTAARGHSSRPLAKTSGF